MYIKEIFSTVQGEGYFCGTPSTFVRFSGCNLWSGRLSGRSNGNPCAAWCDTDFVGGVHVQSDEIVEECLRLRNTHIVLTGGEPLLQAKQPLIDAMQRVGLFVAVETNGTIPLRDAKPDWVTCSPKLPKDKIVIERIDELKFCLPSFDPLAYLDLHTRMDTTSSRLFIQPVDGIQGSLQNCLDFLDKNKNYRVSAQLHKMWGLR